MDEQTLEELMQEIYDIGHTVADMHPWEDDMKILVRRNELMAEITRRFAALQLEIAVLKSNTREMEA